MAIEQQKVAEKLAALRAQHGLTQEQASEKAGVAVRQWQRWEGAETMPYPKNLEKLAAAFGLSVSDFFEDHDIQPVETPDVMASLNGDGKKLLEQLDRIEKKLDRLLADKAKSPTTRTPRHRPTPRQKRPT
jgi:transcriptional regulator with XRE-family HTH domain